MAGSTYYFKWEPVIWKVLSNESDGVRVLSQSILDLQGFYKCSSKVITWETSDLRSWLNGEFCETAFSDNEKGRIVPDTHENGEGNDTTDDIWLLSLNDILNTAYGFSSEVHANDPARAAQGTDYAKCQGIWVDPDFGNSYWALRSTRYLGIVDTMFFDYAMDGVHTAYGGTSMSNRRACGTRPAFKLDSDAIVSTSDSAVCRVLGHDWGTPTYSWTKDGSVWKCTAERVCTRNASHKETETVTAVGAQSQAPTCTAQGKTKYTATFTNSAFTKQEKEETDIAANGHDFSDNAEYCLNGCGTRNNLNKIGDDVYYYLDESGALKVYGTGTTYDYSTSEGNPSPFSESTDVKSIVVEEGVTRLGNSLFYECGAESIVLPDSLTDLGTSALGGMNNLTSLHIPKGLTNRDDLMMIFASGIAMCGGITTVTVDEDNACYTVEDNVIFNKDKTVMLWYVGTKQDKTYTVPDSVTRLLNYSFSNANNLETLIIPEGSFTTVDSFAVMMAEKLKTVYLPASTTTINAFSFRSASNLSDIYFGGTEAQWQSLTAAINPMLNPTLLNATVHYAATITFNANGGTGTMNAVDTYTSTKYELPDCGFNKDGRSFYAWKVGDELKQPSDVIDVAGNTEVKAIWVYTTGEQVDWSTDPSTTTVKGTMTLTDTRTGKVYTKSISETAASSLTNPFGTAVDAVVEETKTALTNEAAGIAGAFAVTGEADITDVKGDITDNRTHTTIFGYDANLPASLEATDENGDYKYYFITEGELYHTWTVTVTLDATFTSDTPAVTLDGWTYGETANEPVVTGNNAGGTPVFSYKAKDAHDSTYSSAVPTEAGDYTVRAELPANDVYGAETVTADFTVAKAAVTVTAKDKSSYRGKELKALTYAVTGAYVDGDELNIALRSLADRMTAGEYAITVTAENPNYDITLVDGTYTVKDRITAEERMEAKAAIDTNAQGKTGDKALTVKWGKVKGATKYEIYATYCGKNSQYKKIATVKGSITQYDIKKLNGKKLNPKKNVKVYVVAYRKVGGEYKKLAKSVSMHIAGAKVNRTNAKKITLKKSKFTLKVGKTAKIKATVILENNKKKPIDHTAKLRYRSSDKSVATVDKNGKIKAKKKGKVTITVYANNGVSKKVTVIVK